LVFARLYLDTGDGHRAEDLLQETYLVAFRSLHRLADPAGFRPWLLTIAHTALVDAARRDARQKRSPPPRSETPLSAIPGGGPRPDEVAERAETRQRVLGVLRSLAEVYRLRLTLRYIIVADAQTICGPLAFTNWTRRC